MNSYDLSRKFVDFSFENPSKIKPNHYALYFFAIEHCNRLGWKKEYGLPTTMTMEAIGIKSYNTYIKTFNELVEFGFLKVIERSKNQYSSNIIELSNFDKALDKALDKAFIKHATKQSESTQQSIDSINKPINKRTKEQKTINNTLLSEINISDVDEKEKFYFEVAVAFQKLFIKNIEEKKGNTKHQKNATFKNYVNPIRLMFEKDEVTKEQVTKVFEYLKSDRCESASFSWKTNILSTAKLREKFNQLLIKSTENGKQANNKKGKVQYSDDFKRRVFEKLQSK